MKGVSSTQVSAYTLAVSRGVYMRRVFIVLVFAALAIFAVAQSSPAGYSTPPANPSSEVRTREQIRVDPPSESASVAELESSADKLREQNMYRDAIDYYD